MRGITTTGIVLARTDFQEADRIITVLTPDYGKLRLMAKGVRRERSKLAAGIELFSVSNITFLPGRKEIGTLISSRLLTHCAEIVRDINRTMLGYDLLKRVNRATEDNTGPEYFELLENAMRGLNDGQVSLELLELWFSMQLLKISGHTPNLKSADTGEMLSEKASYVFDFDATAFHQQAKGPFKSNHIKLLRLVYGLDDPIPLKQVEGADTYAKPTLALAKNILRQYVRS